MKKLFIVRFATEDENDIEWFWCNTEDEAREEFANYLKELGWEDEADILDIYEVEIPKAVLLDIQTNKPIDTQVCYECGESVKGGSGKFVNRIPSGDDYETRVEMGVKHPEGEYLCEVCDEHAQKGDEKYFSNLK